MLKIVGAIITVLVLGQVFYPMVRLIYEGFKYIITGRTDY